MTTVRSAPTEDERRCAACSEQSSEVMESLPLPEDLVDHIKDMLHATRLPSTSFGRAPCESHCADVNVVVDDATMHCVVARVSDTGATLTRQPRGRAARANDAVAVHHVRRPERCSGIESRGVERAPRIVHAVVFDRSIRSGGARLERCFVERSRRNARRHQRTA